MTNDRAELVRLVMARAKELGTRPFPLKEGYATIEALQTRLKELGPFHAEMIGKTMEVYLQDEIPRLHTGRRLVTITKFDKEHVYLAKGNGKRDVRVRRAVWDRLVKA